MSKKILIIDDEVQFAKVVAARLESNGYEISIAHDGKDGITKARIDRPDLIIIDILMPNMNGGDAVRLLKADPRTTNIPIIFLTAILDSNKNDSGQRINVDNKFYPAIAKPFDAEKLLEKVEELLFIK